MKTLDLKKELKYLYAPSAKKAEIVKVPRLQFAMIDGVIEKGKEPGNSPAFAEATQALYSISYTLKFMLKKHKTNAIDYPVMALEGLWGIQDVNVDVGKKDNWSFTLMILQPAVITKDIFAEGMEQVRKKKGDSPELSKVRLSHFEEGICAQMMHIGPYATEPATIEIMRALAAENGYRDNVGPNGLHPEIYLGDPRKADPAKLKTVVRHPLKKV
ncbi:MAG: GyrI-like domain-containing protein [Anaerolineae bacterium]|nr:GyrI-like domain-containing protein [Anaerolineae bacterium]MBL8104250.1 GyrI-like domain-containing protein [Anaerolineales bacterium]MCC7189939.1 GyrI-like domain-containing protein [Anaerolineales bacterium]